MCSTDGMSRRVTRSADKTPVKPSASSSSSSPITSSSSSSSSSSKPPSYTHPPAPSSPSKLTDHMSGLLFSGSYLNTFIELLFLAVLFNIPPSLAPSASMPPRALFNFALGKSLFTRVYNAYLEAVFFAYPQHRTQPSDDHKLKKQQDLTGRDQVQQDTLVYHDRMTLITDNLLNITLYLLIPGFYPLSSSQPFLERAARLVLNHYLMSLGMYWSHRALHVVPYLWREIHSIHHYAKTPLSRVTYQDHWFDNFGNAVVGQTFAQILIPLDLPTFVVSRVFRVAESLEKHSGHSSGWNLAHAVQYKWMPFAQMPHHHDWHHEGFKSCNYTFSSLGGVWDYAFNTRRTGRAANPDEPAGKWATRLDEDQNKRGKEKVEKSVMDSPYAVVLPDLAIGAAAAYKLWTCGGSICY